MIRNIIVSFRNIADGVRVKFLLMLVIVSVNMSCSEIFFLDEAV